MPDSNEVLIKLLTAKYVEEFRALRLRGLKEDPEAFGAAYEESSESPMSEWLQTLDQATGSFVLGAFNPDLVGIVGFLRPGRIKRRHKGLIWGTYVAPEARGRGIGKALMLETLTRARSLEGLEEVNLFVVIKNEAARDLYLKLGFCSYGIEKRALKINGEYFDEELLSMRLD
jgi:RimJ/RimL family protein N-acetyltransferase